MNAFDFVKGFLIFSSVCVLVFGIGAALGNQYDSPNTQEMVQLAGKYNTITNYTNAADDNSSTLITMKNQMDNSNPTSLELSSFFLRGGIEAAKTLVGLITLPISMILTTSDSLNGFIPPIFRDLIVGIITAGFIIILLVLIMRVKPET